MPTLDEIFRNFSAVWRLMTGHSDGLNELDTSADGFWRSFNALLVALPALLIGWVNFAADVSSGSEDAALRLSVVLRMAFIDMTAWLLPLVLIAALSRKIGIERRFSTYVVASNWGTALIAWLFAPLSLINLLIPSLAAILTLAGIALFLFTLLLSYQLTKLALQRPHGFALPFYLVLFFGSLMVTLFLQHLLGISAIANNIPHV